MIYKLKYPFKVPAHFSFDAGYRNSTMMMFPWRAVSMLFPQDSQLKDFEGKPVQRNINKARVRKLADYLWDRLINDKRFVLPPIILTMMPREPEDLEDIGNTKIPFNTFPEVSGEEVLEKGVTIVINDGQHRVEAIRMVLARMRKLKPMERKALHPLKRPDFGAIELPAQVHVCYEAADMQQMFADINANASKPSKSISLFFDKANDFNASVAKLIKDHHVFQGRTDIQKNTVSGRSHMVFTVAGITAVMRCLFPGKKNGEGLTDDEMSIAAQMFDMLSYLWTTDVDTNTAEKLREFSCAPHVVWMKGMAMAVRSLIDTDPENWLDRLDNYVMCHQRSSVFLRHRCVDHTGKIIAGQMNTILVCNILKVQLALGLTEAEEAAEKAYRSMVEQLNDLEARSSS